MIIRMALTQIIFLMVFLIDIWAFEKCPTECLCSLDYRDRLQTICTKGGMNKIPVSSIDVNVQVIIINGPNNNLNIGPIFQQFSHLQILRITDSNIPAIGENSFWGVVNLQILDLSRNNITTITAHNFKGQNSLRELDLSNNKIDRMPSATFLQLISLESLSLANNFIKELAQRQFLLLGKLQNLDLSGNPLIELPPDVFKDVTNLKIFKCRHCQLAKIHSQFYQYLRNLTVLDLGYNQFRHFEQNEFKSLQRLIKLELDGNQLTVIGDNWFEAQKSLQFLDLSYNQIDFVENMAFENLHNLTYLDLSYNDLSKLEMEALYPLSNLQTFNISGNIQMDLNEVKYALQSLPELTTLSLADMGTLPSLMELLLPSVRSLNLSGNYMDSVSLQILAPVNNFEHLDLSRNLLTGFSDEVIVRLLRIKDVNLADNRLICDKCHMEEMINKFRNVDWQSDVICYLPESLRGASIRDLNSDALDWCMEVIENEDTNEASTSSHNNFLDQGSLNILALLAGTIFILLAVLVLGVVICYSRHRAKYYTHEDKMGDLGNTEKEGLEAPNSITSNEISFKFPIDDRVCTIDELCLPPPPPTPSPPNKSVPLLG